LRGDMLFWFDGKWHPILPIPEFAPAVRWLGMASRTSRAAYFAQSQLDADFVWGVNWRLHLFLVCFLCYKRAGLGCCKRLELRGDSGIL
jgi:hypothetical protein